MTIPRAIDIEDAANYNIGMVNGEDIGRGEQPNLQWLREFLAIKEDEG
jgi:hypothetical protein